MSNENPGITVSDAAIDRVCQTLADNNKAQLDFASELLGRMEGLAGQLIQAKMADDSAVAERRAANNAVEMARIESEERQELLRTARAVLNGVDFGSTDEAKNAAIRTATGILGRFMAEDAAA